MANLAYRRDVVFRGLGSYVAPYGSVSVMALPAGAQVASNSSGTTATVRAGHGFLANDKFIIWRNGSAVASSFNTVTAVTSTTLTITATTLVAGDVLVNLGADTGVSSPNWDGVANRTATFSTYADMAGAGPANTNATVSTNSSGEFSYYTAYRRIWELCRASVQGTMTVLDVVQDVLLRSASTKVLSIADYGADPTNTDNSAAITQAITDAIALSGSVLIPTGVFKISSKITVASGTNLAFVAEPGGTIKWYQDSSNATTLIECTQCTGITFDGLILDGNTATIAPATNGQNGIDFNYNSTGLTIRNCTFQNIGDTAIADRSHSQATATLNNTSDAQFGKTVITGNRFTNCEGCYNTKGGGKRSLTVVNNHVKSCYSGFKIDSETNVTNFSTYGTYTNKGGQAVISGNVFETMGAAGASGLGYSCIHVEEYSRDIIIANNVLRDIDYIDGIIITEGQSQRDVVNVVIANNIMSNMTNANPITIRNDSQNGLGAGFNYPTTFDSISISGNLISDTEGLAIYISVNGANIVKSLVIKNNDFREWDSLGDKTGPAGQHCIFFNMLGTSELRNCSITGNTFKSSAPNSGKYVIQCNNASGVTADKMVVSGNRFLLNAIGDSLCYFGLQDVAFVNNECRYGQVYFSGNTTELFNNTMHGVRINVTKTGTTEATLYSKNNRFSRDGAETFAMSLTDASVVYDDGNTYASGYTNNITVANTATYFRRGAYSGTEVLQSTNAAQWVRGEISELITLSTSGLTTDSSANLLPANSIIEAVVARITTTITVTTNWALGDGTTAARFSAASSTLTAGTTVVGMQHQQGSVSTDATGPVQVAAAKLRITCTGSNPGAGAIRVTVYYRQFVAPTS